MTLLSMCVQNVSKEDLEVSHDNWARRILPVWSQHYKVDIIWAEKGQQPSKVLVTAHTKLGGKVK